MESIILLCLATIASAQQQLEFSGGMLTGISKGSLQIVDYSSSHKMIHANELVGFEAGAYMKARINPFYLKPVILFSSQYSSADYYEQSGANVSPRKVSFSIQRVEVPVLLGITLIGPWNVETGPFLEYIIPPDVNSGPEVNTANTGLGFRLNTSLEVKRWCIYFGYAFAGTFYSAQAAVKDIYRLNAGIGFRFISSTFK